MTNKMPVVGKRYRNKEHKTNIIVKSIKDDWVVTKGFCKIHISNFWDWFEELPDSNSQETEGSEVERALEELKLKLKNDFWCESQYHYELLDSITNLIDALEAEKKPFFKVREEGQFEGSPPTKETFARHEETIKRMKEGLKETEECCPIETAEAAWNMSEVSEVERALEESKRILRERYSNPEYGQELLEDTLTNLVRALEDGKIESRRGIAEYTPSDFMKHMERCKEAIKNMPKQEPKWLPMSSAPKCGSPITVNQSTNKRHKIFKANWLNKWYSLYEEGNNEEVYPEFWLEGSKEEPEIDMKKESVEPVSIWKDNKDELKKLEKQNEKFLIRTKDGRVIMPIVSNYFTSDNQIDKNIKEATTLTDFINSFEQEKLKHLDMEARLRKLEGK